MKRNMTKILLCTIVLGAIGSVSAVAQQISGQAEHSHDSHDHSQSGLGPHGGALQVVSGLQFETIVSEGGFKVFVQNSTGKDINVQQTRGALSLSLEGSAKRYRYDLLPDGKGALVARVNLSKITGRKIELEMTLVGLPGVGNNPLSMTQTATVPSNYEVVVSELNEADKSLIAKQAKCPVMDESLGSMGSPVKLLVGDKPIFLCCKGCIKKVQAEPLKYLVKVHGDPSVATVPAGTEQVREGVYKVGEADKAFITAQKKCPVMDEPLEGMGGPYKVHADGKAIYICCPGCAKRIAAEPKKYLDVLTAQGVQAPSLK